MPALPSPGKVVKLILTWGQNDSIAENVFYFSYTGGTPSISDLSGLAGYIETDLLAPYVGAGLAGLTMNQAKYIDLSSSTGAEYTHAPAFTGTNTGNVLSANNAVCVQKVITRRYRGGHPRTYMMVGGDGDLASGSSKNWQGSFLTNIQNGFNTFQALFPHTLPMGAINPVNVSFYETVLGVKTVRATPLVDTISAWIAKERVCSQRRRLGKANA